MDNTTLESSIKRESEEMIAAIKDKETAEIRRLDEDYAAEIERFRKKIEAETQARIDQELSRLENKAILERKKLNLTSVEQFINCTVEEVMKGIRNNPRYRQFLVNAACSAALQISGGVEVRLKREDLVLGEEITAAIRKARGSQPVVINADASIGWGGCLVLDEAQGRIFNHTLERISYRKALLIRQKAVKVMTDHTGDDKK
ncbi:MAG: hypothetical protein CVU71_04550 [Deltaproteobacteria bacterium HGW-Deltaproteobacteria-6]|nr:MAG: hypothetical protein CVU71_04550 [Deltaproteobacteria bacterium HGW-Deltaproteobacteria-6]